MGAYSSKNKTGFRADFLKLIIVFLLLIVASEAGFLIRGQLSQKPQEDVPERTSQPISLAKGSFEFKYFVWEYIGWLQNLGFNPDYLPKIRTTLTLGGEVTQVARLDPYANEDFIGYQVAFTRPNGQKILFSISEYLEVPNAKVVIIKDDEKVETDLDEIKPGDFITVHMDMVFFSPEPYTQYFFEIRR